MKNAILFALALLGLFAVGASAQGDGAGMGPQAGIHEAGTGLVEPELKEVAQGTGQGLTEVGEMTEEHIAKADAFVMSLPDNGFYRMEMTEVIDSVDAGDESLLILDVRPAALYDAGHIPDSVSIPLTALVQSDLVAGMNFIPVDKKIAVVCTYDTNSAYAVSILRIFGYSRDAWVVVGGVPAWVEAGRELVPTEEM